MNWYKRFMRSLPNEFTLTQIQDAAIRIEQYGGPIDKRQLIERLENLLWDTPGLYVTL